MCVGIDYGSSFVQAGDDSRFVEASSVLFSAARALAGDKTGSTHAQKQVRDALARLAPLVHAMVAGFCRAHTVQLKQARLESADVEQHVLERILTRPPTNPRETPALPTFVAWCRTVATNHLLDRLRRKDSDAPVLDAPETVEAPREAEDRVTLGDVVTSSPARRCAEEHLVRFTHCKRVFDVLTEQPYLSGLELAAAIGLLEPSSADGERARKAAQHAWQLRSRTLRRLADCVARSRGEAGP